MFVAILLEMVGVTDGSKIDGISRGFVAIFLEMVGVTDTSKIHGISRGVWKLQPTLEINF